jgi:hypothetical protein
VAKQSDLVAQIYALRDQLKKAEKEVQGKFDALSQTINLVEVAWSATPVFVFSTTP